MWITQVFFVDFIDKASFFIYNTIVYVSIEIQMDTKQFEKGELTDENDFTAEKETENEGARLQKENVYEERQKRFEEKKSQRQKETDRLMKKHAEK